MMLFKMYFVHAVTLIQSSYLLFSKVIENIYLVPFCKVLWTIVMNILTNSLVNVFSDSTGPGMFHSYAKAALKY